MASAPVTARLPVGLAPHGTRPSRLANRTKKKSVITNGAYLAPVSCPMFAMAMSFRTKRTSPSIAAPKPLGAFSLARWRWSARPASHIDRNTSVAASTM